ncbi:MAG: magnesium transporter [Thermoplasmatota archaeon]
MYHWKSIVRFGLPLLTLCIFIEIFVGQLLQQKNDFLLKQLPIFLVSIPVINSVGGNIGSILGAHLASGLHVGSIRLDIKDKTMRETLVTSLLMGAITYCSLSIGIYLLGIFTGVNMDIHFFTFAMILLSTGFVLICLLSIISVFTAFISFKKGLDPDDVVSPVVTTVGDSLGIVLLFFFIGVVGL